MIKNKKPCLIIVFLYCFFLFSSADCFPQQPSVKNFKIYVDARQLDSSTKKFLAANNISEIQRITRAVIKPDSNGVPDIEKIKKIIVKMYPNDQDSGVFVLDWEDKEAKELILLDSNSARFKFLIQQYKSVVLTIKGMRPNVLVGVFGFPIRVNNVDPSKTIYRDIKKLYPLLKIADFLNPSYYILYPDSEVGKQKNINYLKENLNNAFKTAKDLNKPVIAYTGNRYYNRASQSNLRLIPQNEFRGYVDYLINFKSSDGNKISGLILWNGDDSVDSIAQKEIKDNKSVFSENFVNEHNNMLRNYLSILIESSKLF